MAWVEKAEVKAIMETTSDKHDTAIDLLITFVEKAFKTLSNNPIDSSETTETFRLHRGKTIVLSRYPVTAISKVSITEDNWEWDFDSDNYITYKKTGIIEFDTRFTGKVAVTYTAGDETVPIDIKDAVIFQVISLLKKKNRLGLASLGKRGETTTFKDIPWLPEFLAVVELYKNPIESKETV